MARVLVTGATGFAGRFVPGILAARGHEVHLVARGFDGVEWPTPLPSSCVFHRADLLAHGSSEALLSEIRPTHLVHMAWYTEPGKFWSSSKNLDWVAASLLLFQAFVRAGGRRFVGAGTCAEYDWNYSMLVPGETPLNPSTAYGNAKARLYQLLSQASRDAGISFAWGRIFFPFGPWENSARLLPLVIAGLLNGKDVDLSEGAQIRDFVYSGDVGQIFADLTDSAFEGAVNVGSGEGLSVRNFVEMAARPLGRSELLHFGRRPEGVDATPRMVADVTSLRALVDSRPPIGVAEGLARTVAWWKSRQAPSQPGLVR